LVFRAASDETMSEIGGDTDYLVLTGLQAFGAKIFSSEARAFLLKHLDRQLKRMTERGALLHAEIGPTSPDGLNAMTELIKHHIKSIGLNTEELEKITGDKQFEGLAAFFKERSGKAEDDEAIMVRYERANHLAEALNVDELYVHGNDVDLILRKGAPRGALWQEVETVLFTKGAVIAALLLRSQKKRWKEVLLKKVQPVLLKKGFMTLLELAKGFAKSQANQGASEYPEPEIFKNLAFSGYHYQKDNSESYSVLAVPVMWPSLKENISTAGAGDITSSVVAVFTGK
jgi:ADP-dependent phosphofructokinase/glucokinase